MTGRALLAFRATTVAGVLALAACGGGDAAVLPTATGRAVVPEVSAPATAPLAAAAPSATPGSPSPTASPRPASSSPPPPEPVPPATGAGSVDTSDPDRVVGDGTPESCTSEAVVEAVAAGGVIVFDCGPDPVTIAMRETAKVVNAANPRVVLDGGGRVTLSGGGERRILYQNTCDRAQGWTTSHCDDQDHPHLVIQRLGLTDGDATGETRDGGGGGAVFVRGGRLTIVDSTFTGNRCDGSGPDVGGAAVRVLDQFEDRPVLVARSTFTGGVCSNGGALSSIGVSWEIDDSAFTGNRAIGTGANPARAGTPGGGSGGAVYLDGNRFTLTLARTRIEDNTANEGGGAVFFVSNDRTGTMRIEDSTLRGNPSRGFETAGFPGIFFLGTSDPEVVGSTLS
ncbi:MAG: hypothetical protein ACFCVG_04725 [Kineosporiaceae bacterium]